MGAPQGYRHRHGNRRRPATGGRGRRRAELSWDPPRLAGCGDQRRAAVTTGGLRRPAARCIELRAQCFGATAKAQTPFKGPFQGSFKVFI